MRWGELNEFYFQKKKLQTMWSYQHFIFKITKIFIIDNNKYLSKVRFYIRMKESICRVYTIMVSRQWGRGESPQFASLWLWHFWFVNSQVWTDDLFLAAVLIGHPLHLFFFWIWLFSVSYWVWQCPLLPCQLYYFQFSMFPELSSQVSLVASTAARNDLHLVWSYS